MRRRFCLTLVAVGLFVGTAVMPDLGRPVSAQGTPVDVVLGRYVFEPAELVVPAGVVTFNLTNVDSRRHDMVIEMNGTFLESEIYGAGEGGVWETTLDQPGTYRFWCEVDDHADRGMVGTITVQ
jgi:plastocyanin